MKTIPLTKQDSLRYRCYKAAVQDPDDIINVLNSMYAQTVGGSPRTFREDFCGTFFYASEWVRRFPHSRAIGLDINPRPLAFGTREHTARLTPAERRRLQIIECNVLASQTIRADLIAACNFSFYVLKRRADLERYCRNAYRALNRRGMFALEMVGGSAFEESPFTERRSVPHSVGPRRGKRWFTYAWNHKSFNPITREGLYSITFSFPDGRELKDTFVYDWRVWTIPEVRECLLAGGFDEVEVFWEDEDTEQRDLGTYSARTEAPNHPTWLCYVVGIKR
jgi:SAM-dependent methyltransferase